MHLYGRDWTRRELEARIGHLGQIGGIRRMKLTEGKEAGVELIRVRTGAGLAFDIVPSKGLDISSTELWGVPISWQSPNGDVSPAYYDPEGTGWLRTASGGLLMTCGLSHVGSPSVTEADNYGLHGRAHHTPARQVNIQEEWIGDLLEWRVSGIMEDTSIFGAKLRLHRVISGRLGENHVTIEDRVENMGFTASPHMMLYHFNFGFPLLGERTTIQFPPANIEPREAGRPTEICGNWERPDPTVSEGVYYHHLRPLDASDDGMAEVQIHNPSFPSGGDLRPLTAKLRWSADTLPMLVQWRMPGAGEHVLGLEPANCKVEGRTAEKDLGGPRMLAPNESVLYRLELIL